MDCFDGRAWKARTRETCRYFQRTVEGVRKRHFRLSAPDAKVENFMRNQCAHLLSGGFLRVWGCVKAQLLRVGSMGMVQRRLNNLLLSGWLSDCQHLGWTMTAFLRGWMGKWLPVLCCVMERRRAGAQWVYCAVSKAVIFCNPQCTACARIASRLPLK